MNPAASAPASGTAGPTATDPVPSDPARTDPAPGEPAPGEPAPGEPGPSHSGPSDHDQAPAGDAEHHRARPDDRAEPGGRMRPAPADSGRAPMASDHVWPGDPAPVDPAALGPSGPPPAAFPPADIPVRPVSPARSARRSARRSALSRAAIDLQWLLGRLVDDVPGIRSVVVVSSDGLLLLSSEAAGRGPVTGAADPTERGPEGANGGLSTIVSGLGSLTVGAARLMDAGEVRQTVIAMDYGNLFVMSVSDGSLLGVHADPDCDVNVVAYEMGLFVGRAGHVLTPEVRGELRLAADPTASLE